MAVEPVAIFLVALGVAANVVALAWFFNWGRRRVAGEVQRRGGRLHGMRYRHFALYRGWDVTYTDAFGRTRTERMVPGWGYVWQATGEGAASPGEAVGQTALNPSWWAHGDRPGLPLLPRGQAEARGRGFIVLWLVVAVFVTATALLGIAGISALTPVPAWFFLPFLVPLLLGAPIAFFLLRVSRRAPQERQWIALRDDAEPATSGPTGIAAAWRTPPGPLARLPPLDPPPALPLPHPRRSVAQKAPRSVGLQLAGGGVAALGAVLAFAAFPAGSWPLLLGGVGLLLLGGVLVFAGS